MFKSRYYYRAISYNESEKFQEANQDYSQALLANNFPEHSGLSAAVNTIAISSDGVTLASGSIISPL
ncbi:MAG: hypothetical protein RM338_11385 [Nostoc sp. DedQUE12a]|nr:hypothetical protein [Nostoc sp. DedQUE12a]